jgi:CubicO group peptidase (beta-lactamase class C family)
MKKVFVFLFLGIFTSISDYSVAQTTYFPPNSGTWETTSPETFGWCQERIDSLFAFLEASNSKSFILLKDGKIVLESYFNGHGQGSLWYWASAGKTLTAFMVGIAQQENYLHISDTTSQYLGQGWTTCTPAQEEKITIWNQLTMTSGLDDGVADPFCTIDTCLTYLANPGTRWAYHNGPYTLLDDVIELATGVTLNQYTTQKLKNPTGMNGSFVSVDFNNVYFSDSRSMARFGLLIQNKGNWNGNQIMTDSTYFNAMVNTSQNLNKSYGYLWWLNGKSSYMVPGLQVVIPGMISPQAPSDVIMALGKDGQIINVSESENMVWIRMGEQPGNVLVPYLLNDQIWAYINKLNCTTGIQAVQLEESVKVFPNPFLSSFRYTNGNPSTHYYLINSVGTVVWSGQGIESQDFSDIPKGIYFLRIREGNSHRVARLVKL